MKREWQPGDVAMVTVPNGSEHRAIRKDNGDWLCLAGGCVGWLCVPEDVRPLVVIDPEDDEAVKRLCDAYRSVDHGVGTMHMQAALREFADPKPSKPDEPTGLGAVVRDAKNNLFVRALDGWWRGYSPFALNWEAVHAVEVLSEGYNQGADEPLADWERDLLRGDS